MEPQEEPMTYYGQAEQQWEYDRAHTRRGADEAREALEQGRPGPVTPQYFEPGTFHPREAEKIVVVYTRASGKAPETFPPSWAHEHGRFNAPPDVERIEFIKGDKKFWVW
jgi:hypothetical protein